MNSHRHGNGVPRIDSHRHLGGSIGPQFVWRVIQDHSLSHLAEAADDVYDAMVFSEHEPRGFHRFLDKFKILDHIPWTEELIDESIRLVCGDLRQERLDYCWMRFSINKYMDAGIKWHRWQAIQFIRDCFERHLPGRVGLMLSIKYESSRAGQRQLAQLIDNPAVAESVIGLDLVGDESYFDPEFYTPIFKHWQAAGKIACGHVGESQTAHNVRACIEMGVRDIAHGFQIWKHPEYMAMAKDHDVVFHMAITSNYLTGCWTDLCWHPLRTFLEYGLRCTIGTDDPVQCGCTLDSEYQFLRERLGFTSEELERLARIAAGRSARLLASANAPGKFTMGN